MTRHRAKLQSQRQILQEQIAFYRDRKNTSLGDLEKPYLEAFGTGRIRLIAFVRRTQKN
jgi:hypothetical protein